MTTQSKVNEYMGLGLGIHATAYVAVVSGLATLNPGDAPKPWVLWVARGWGIGLAAHALTCRALQSRERSDL